MSRVPERVYKVIGFIGNVTHAATDTASPSGQRIRAMKQLPGTTK